MKIGVGKKPAADYDMVKWVLGEIPSEKQNDLGSALQNSVGAVEEILTDSVDKAMNDFNS